MKESIGLGNDEMLMIARSVENMEKDRAAVTEAIYIRVRAHEDSVHSTHQRMAS